VVALIGSRLIHSLLYCISSADPLVYMSVLAVLTGSRPAGLLAFGPTSDAR
jgi:hypothetical protein